MNSNLPSLMDPCTAHQERWDRVLQANHWYSELPVPTRWALLSIAVPQNLVSGQYLFHRGDVANGVYAVVQGSIHISRTVGLVSDSKKALLLVLTGSNWFGETALFDQSPRTHDARASGATCVVHLGKGALEPLLQAFPVLWKDFGQLLTSKARLGLQMIEDLTTLPAKTRLAARLLELADGCAQRGVYSPVAARLLVRMSQTELAMLVGCTRQTVNSMLTEMRDCGWIRVGRGVIEVCNPVALKREACGPARHG